MRNSTKKFPRECIILIVDDDPLICDLLRRALENNFKVYTCNDGKTALQYIDEYNPDVVVTDLKIPEVSGLEVLQYAKKKDEFTEVIVITGHPSLDSATLAINQGVYSYLLKPLQINEFLVQVEKAVASRLFHLKSLEIMRASEGLAPDVKKHFEDITILYHFLRKLMLSLEIPEIMRVSLDEINRRTEAILSIINVSFLGYKEMYVMPSVGEITEEHLSSMLSRFKEQIEIKITNEENKKEIVPVIYKGRCGKTSPTVYSNLICYPVPMMVTDKVIGNLILFFNSSYTISADLNQFLYIFSSIVSSAVEHGYITLQARQQAKTDSLTGISNHRHFHEILDKEISRANRRKSSFSLIFIDIDNFKRINDQYGHQVGDAVLIDMTNRIKSIIRSGDVLARYGGEEFAIILPDATEEGAKILAERVIKTISQKPFVFVNNEIYYTVSIGVTTYNGNNPVDKNHLIAVVDKALYRSKENGKNQYTIEYV